MDDTTLSATARRLGSLLEPVTGQVYFSPECHAEYVALGFDPSPSVKNGVALPDGPAYFTSRGSVMGQVSGQVIAAAFAVFNPAVVVPCVELGWTRTDATTISAARDNGAIGQLRRILGDEPQGLARVIEILKRMVEPLRPEGRPLFAGLQSLGLPADRIGAMWRLGDMLREYRGDSHTASWISAGIDATEIGLMSELYWGLPPRSYSRTRAWTADDFDAATERLQHRGILDDQAELTAAGRRLREDVEMATDRQMRATIHAGGDDLDELFTLLAPWGEAIRAAGGYLATGPHDLARTAGNRG
jgi:hypothetical protein